MRKALRVVLLASMLLHTGVTSAEDDADLNAAPLYLALYEDERYTALDWRAIEKACFDVGFADNWSPDPVIQSLILDQDFAIQCKQIAAIELCDFGLDYTEGLCLKTPHIAPAKVVSNFFLADSRIKIDQGKTESGIDSLFMAIAVARHLENDHSPVTAVVRMKILTRAFLIAEQVDANNWTLHSIKEYSAFLDGFRGDDPFGVRRVIRHDSISQAAWITRMSKSPEGIEEILDEIGLDPAVPDGEHESPRATLLNEVMQAGGFVQCARLYKPLGDAQVKAMNSIEPRSELHKLEQRILRGEFGPLGKHLAPPAIRYFEEEELCRQALGFNQMSIPMKLFELEDAELYPPGEPE